jgi:LacI family transcriptional regulator
VAQAARVSPTTASLVLNGRDLQIPDATRQRVLDAARRLGYRPDRLARSLVSRKSEILGVTFPFVENPFFSHLLADLNRKVGGLGRRVLFEVTDLQSDETALLRAVELLLDWRIDGLLHWWDESYRHDVRPFVQEKPVVFFGSSFPDDISDAVCLDDYGGARAAVEHLLELGHRRIAHISRGYSDGRQRALVDALAERGCPPPLVYSCPSVSPEEAEGIAGSIAALDDPPTAVFCHNDVIAFGALRGFRDHGLRVPQDVSLVGYDDSWTARYVEPPLTTVVFPHQEILRQALDLLVRRIAGETFEPRRILLPGALVVRESTASPRSRS